ncbi:MAG: alginate export family protein [Bacteroidota bacterium]
MTKRKTGCHHLMVVALFSLLFGFGGYGQEQSPEYNLAKIINEGEFVFNGKLRFWHADDEAARASRAYTFGTNFGYLTKSYNGFQMYIEGESVVALTPDLYFDGLNDETDRTNVTDPETFELNQLHVAYADTLNTTTIQFKVGRQAAIVEDERFIGRVQARQDDQTFDAIYTKVQNDEKGLSFEHAYIYQVNRLLAEEIDWRSDSHAFVIGYYKNPMARIGLFSHLLDFRDDSPSLSSQTFGITIDRSTLPKDRIALNYKTAFAYQSDYGDNPTAYDAFLINTEVGVSLPGSGIFNLGYELASSDNGIASYQFPLSTGQRLHRISDVFIDPPADGLHNPYFTAESNDVVWGIGGFFGYHTYFSEEEGTLLGQEIDLVIYKQIVPNLLKAELTYSSFFGDDPAYTDLHIIALDLVFEL